MNTIKWIVIGIIAIGWTSLSFYSGRKSVKIPTPNTWGDTIIVVNPTDTIYQTITKFIKAKKDTVFIDSTSQNQTVYSELIDTTITFNSDSLDFVADIQFFDSTKTFKNTFDFQLRTKKIIEEVWREVSIYKIVSNRFFIEGGGKASDKLYYYGKAGVNAINSDNFKLPIYYQIDGRSKATHSLFAGARLEF